MDIRISQCSSVNRLLYCPGESILSFIFKKLITFEKLEEEKKKKAKQKQDSRLN